MITHRILQRINISTENMSMATLRLFDILFEKNLPEVWDRLVFSFLRVFYKEEHMQTLTEKLQRLDTSGYLHHALMFSKPSDRECEEYFSQVAVRLTDGLDIALAGALSSVVDSHDIGDGWK